MQHRSLMLSAAMLVAVACERQNPTAVNLLPLDSFAAKGGAPTWNVPGDFATIQDAIDDPAVQSGDYIRVAGGSHYGALVSKGVHIVGTGNASIDDGPPHPAGLSQGFRLLAGSDGASFEHLTFTADLAIIAADPVNGVVVSHNAFLNAIQAVSAWRGNGWDISHNTITDLRTRCGGGIGILLGHYSAGVAADNVVSHNTIDGTLHVSEGDCGGYNGTGIVLYADFRFGRTGADEIRDNFVTHNKVGLTSDNAALVDVIAFEMTDTRDDPVLGPATIFDNAVGFNDFRQTATQIVLTPAELADVNQISRNLGDNRGQGLHPSVFKP